VGERKAAARCQLRCQEPADALPSVEARRPKAFGGSREESIRFLRVTRLSLASRLESKLETDGNTTNANDERFALAA
jgi:hypothetical protein